MNRIEGAARTLALVGLLALGVTACADPCGDLEEQCGSCSGTDDISQVVENACNAVVKMDDDDACEAALDSPAYECP